MTQLWRSLRKAECCKVGYGQINDAKDAHEQQQTVENGHYDGSEKGRASSPYVLVTIRCACKASRTRWLVSAASSPCQSYVSVPVSAPANAAVAGWKSISVTPWGIDSTKRNTRASDIAPASFTP